MFKRPHDLETAAHEAEIIEPQTAANKGISIEFEFDDTIGAIMLGVVTVALLFALLRIIGQNRALVTQLRQKA